MIIQGDARHIPLAVKPYYQDDAVTIYHGDCREILPSIGPVDLVLTNPPYGMNWTGKVTRGKNGTGATGPTRHWGTAIVGDKQEFDPSLFLDFSSVVLWGSNHFARHLPLGTTLIWIKRYESGFGSFLSDAEIAWEKGGEGVYCFRDLTLQGETFVRAHPTQKPLSLMKWCLARNPGETILDPFMGSGTTLRAAKDLGRKAIGIEIEEKYCEIAAKRMAQEVLGL